MRYLNHPIIGKISRIGLGTGRFGSIVDEQSSYEYLDYYIANGGNVIDTARNYYEWIEDGRGKSEETIGKWIVKRNNRNKVIVSTKGGVRKCGNRFIANLSKSNLINEAKESMDALQTDYLDIYFLHRDEQNRSVSEIVNTLAYIRDFTKCRMVGVSNWSIERLMEARKYASENNLPGIDAIQVCWSIADFKYEMWNDPTVLWMTKELYTYLFQHNMIVFAYTSQAKGFFQKALSGGMESVSDKLRERIVTDENLNRLEIIRQYCNKYGVSPTGVVNSYITTNRVKGVALVGPSSKEQLKDICDNADSIVDTKWLMQFDPL